MILTYLIISCVEGPNHGHVVVDHGVAGHEEHTNNTDAEADVSSNKVEIASDAEETYSVPDGALLVYDVTQRFPFYVWTEPLSELGNLDPTLVFFTDIEEGYHEDTVEGAGHGGEAHSAGGHAEEGLDVELTTLMFAYVGEVPIESVSVDYTGEFPPLAGAPALPPGWSSWQVGSTSQRRSVAWNYTNTTATVDFEHKHSSGGSYHNLISNQSLGSGRCTYAYDCQYTASGRLRTRLYSSINTDAFSIQFKTSCSASCY